MKRNNWMNLAAIASAFTNFGGPLMDRLPNVARRVAYTPETPRQWLTRFMGRKLPRPAYRQRDRGLLYGQLERRRAASRKRKGPRYSKELSRALKKTTRSTTL